MLMIGGVAMAIGELVLYLEPVKAEGLAMRDRATFAKAFPRRRRVRSKQIGLPEHRHALHRQTDN
jgi:hypothetical protein